MNIINEGDTARDWQGNEQPKPSAKKYKKVHETGSVELFQHISSPKKFAVRYGLQLKQDLDYRQAAKEFGECVMHELASESKLK